MLDAALIFYIRSWVDDFLKLETIVMLIEYCRLFLSMDFSISQKSPLCIAPLTTAVCKFFKIVIGIDFIMLFQSYMYFASFLQFMYLIWMHF